MELEHERKVEGKRMELVTLKRGERWLQQEGGKRTRTTHNKLYALGLVGPRDDELRPPEREEHADHEAPDVVPPRRCAPRDHYAQPGWAHSGVRQQDEELLVADRVGLADGLQRSLIPHARAQHREVDHGQPEAFHNCVQGLAVLVLRVDGDPQAANPQATVAALFHLQLVLGAKRKVPPPHSAVTRPRRRRPHVQDVHFRSLAVRKLRKVGGAIPLPVRVLREKAPEKLLYPLLPQGGGVIGARKPRGCAAAAWRPRTGDRPQVRSNTPLCLSGFLDYCYCFGGSSSAPRCPLAEKIIVVCPYIVFCPYIVDCAYIVD